MDRGGQGDRRGRRVSGGKRVRKEEKRRKKDDAERARIKTESRASASAIREANVASF